MEMGRACADLMAAFLSSGGGGTARVPGPGKEQLLHGPESGELPTDGQPSAHFLVALVRWPALPPRSAAQSDFAISLCPFGVSFPSSPLTTQARV